MSLQSRTGAGLSPLPKRSGLLAGGAVASLALVMLGLASPALAAAPTHRMAEEASLSSAADRCDWSSYEVGSISVAVESGGDRCKRKPGPDAVLTTVQVEGPVVVAEGGGGTATSTATCPAGSVVTGGGWVAAPTPPNPDVEYVILENQRGPGNSWQVTIEGLEDTTFFAVAECATLS